MPLEDVCAVEALFCRTTGAGAESADHGTLVVGQSVSVLVVLASEPFGVVLASGNRALLRALVLVSEHVCLEVFEMPATSRVRAEAFVGFI